MFVRQGCNFSDIFFVGNPTHQLFLSVYFWILKLFHCFGNKTVNIENENDCSLFLYNSSSATF